MGLTTLKGVNDTHMNLHYKEIKNENSPLMVFLHGGGVSGWMWDKQIEHFKNFHCLVPDLPGQGKSNENRYFSINDSAEQIIQLIEEKSKGKTVIVIGFSLGAQILIAMLSMRPNLIHYAMINSALVKPIPFANMLKRAVTFVHPLIKNKKLAKLQAESMYINNDYFETYYEEVCHMSKDLLAQIMVENMSFTIPNTFKNAQSNILATVGEKEKRIMKDSMTEIVQNNPNCKGVIISEIGHGTSLANPILFHHLIESWIGHSSLPKEIQVMN